ncbi:MAG TPA: hypothetical protein VLY24_01120 [Bryobacteraceae bacterium]|nr:hypothetical protein [Bryobacteraceae bacterium]
MRAQAGDTLCGIAIAAGFIDCGALRAEPANSSLLSRPLKSGDIVTVPDLRSKDVDKPTDTPHQFKKKNAPPVSIRYVHGSPDKPYLQDATLVFLLVSKFQVDKGGPTGAAAFPSQFGFQAAGDADIATFKVEVVDPAAGGSVQVTLEALKPILKPDGTIDHHELFTGAEHDARKLEVTCNKVSSGVAYRSKYLRLVVDEADKKGTVGPVPPNTFPPGPGSPKPDQTLLVTDMVDQGEPDVEILDQKVRASYTITRCPGSPKCTVTAELPIGDDRQRLRMFLHVMRRTPGGAPVVAVADAKRRALKWFRRVMAQSSIGPKVLGALERDPVENLVSVSDAGSGNPTPGANAGGSSASGVDASGNPSRLGFRINAAGTTPQTVGPITPSAGDTPITTATALAGLVQAPFFATPAANPRRFNDTQGSADILITNVAGLAVTIDNLVSTDTAQTLTVGSVNPLPVPQQSWDGQNFLVGTLHQRVMCRNYDTGTDRVDVFIVDSTSDGNRGEAMMDGHAVNADATTHGADAIKFSLFAIQTCMNSSDDDPLVLAHEIGHVTGELGHALNVATELMSAQVSGNNAPGASKRLTDRSVQYNITAGSFQINRRLRTEGGSAGILEAW